MTLPVSGSMTTISLPATLAMCRLSLSSNIMPLAP
jgi:hypothetical protein